MEGYHGRVDIITGKTGHYQTDGEALAAAVRQLLEKGADIKRTQVGMHSRAGAWSEMYSARQCLMDESIRKSADTFGASPVVPRQPDLPRRPKMTLGNHRG